MTLICQDAEQGGCRGEVTRGKSRTSASDYEKCEAHWNAYQVFAQELHEKINERYPGYDNPHSSPPEWFDPAYAGEEW